MIGIIVIIAWGALRFVHPDKGTNFGPYVMSCIGWLVSFFTPAIQEGMKAKDAIGMASWPYFLTNSIVPRYVIGGTIALMGIWFAFRVVNMPRAAEFLIAVEAEMVKVSWPNTKEVQVTTVVVITVMMIFCVLLACYDLIWHYLFIAIGVL